MSTLWSNSWRRHALEYFWLHRWQTGSEGTPGWSIYAVSASLHARRSCSSKFVNTLLLSIKSRACMHQCHRLFIMSIYIFFEACIHPKKYCLNMYTWSVYLWNISVKKWLYLRYKKIVAVYSGIKHWFFWHIFCISKYNVYFPKISNVPLECVYVCTYLFVDFFES
jgi:hypothetical protein